MSDFTLKDAAKEIGVTLSTLARIESGEMMDGETLAKILTWLISSTPPAPR
jgi:transcriptional regulator with XRE-family HTH domain